MNERVEEFIEKQKKILKEQGRKEQERKLERRNNFLVELGLIDEEKSKDCPYGEYKAMDVTDEEYAEICKYYSPNSCENKLPKSDEFLCKMSTIFLVVGLISAIILFFCTVTDVYDDFNPISLVYLISISLTSLMTYAFGMAIADIVKNTRK